MVDLSERDFYVIDVFRVTGGTDHAKFLRSHFGTIAAQGVPETSAALFASVPHMRNWRGGPAEPGWSIEWKIEDRLGLLKAPSDLRVRYTDLTASAEAYTGESWVSIGKHGFTSNDDAWTPHIVSRRHAAAGPLASTFVSVIEPFEAKSNIAGLERIPVQTASGSQSDADIAIEVTLTDGRRDLYISRDRQDPPATANPDETISPGGLCLLRCDATGAPALVCLAASRSARIGGLEVQLKADVEYVEIAFEGNKARLIVGQPESIESLTLNDEPVQIVSDR
jgi:hypothetical protein